MTGTKPLQVQSNAYLRYDPLGRLHETIGGTTTRFLYDGDALVAEYDTAVTNPASTAPRRSRATAKCG